jgi:hypothetical protein
MKKIRHIIHGHPFSYFPKMAGSWTWYAAVAQMPGSSISTPQNQPPTPLLFGPL